MVTTESRKVISEIDLRLAPESQMVLGFFRKGETNGEALTIEWVVAMK